ncbi:MAG: hypothetical protein ACLFTJ_13280 [Halothece sp.]
MEPANTIDTETLKTIVKESVREVMREEWFKFFEMLIPYVDDEEQAEIEATFSPDHFEEDDFIDITKLVSDESRD